MPTGSCWTFAWAMCEEWLRTGDASVMWEAHRVGIGEEYCQVEKLAHLDRLPSPFGFKVSCLPVNLRGGSAGWTRAVAIIGDWACQISAKILRKPSPFCLNQSYRMTMSVPRQKCRTPRSRKYLASSGRLISARGGMPAL